TLQTRHTRYRPPPAADPAVAGEDDVRAQIVITAHADLAPPARQRRVHRHRHPVARAALDHHGEFMPGYQRLDQPGVTDAGLGEPVQVRAAQPDRVDTHQLLAG